MHTIYSVNQGDTFDSIARSVFGDHLRENDIRNTNPGVAEPLVAGSTLRLPDNSIIPIGDNVPDTISLAINGQIFDSWSEISLTRTLDSIDTISLSVPFDSGNHILRDTFKPLSFPTVTASIGQDKIFQGTITNVNASINESSNTLSLGGYAKCGIIAECNPSAALFPLEYINQTILTIAESLLAPFGVSVSAPTTTPFDKVAIKPTDSIHGFLIALCRERGLLMRNNIDGNLEIFEPTINNNVITVLSEGSSPLMSVTGDFSGGSYFSHITGITAPTIDGAGAQYTTTNERLDIFRPMNFDINDSSAGDAVQITEYKTSRMFADSIKYNISLVGWENGQGEIWKPGMLVSLTAPGAMIYSPYEFIVKTVNLSSTNNNRSASLVLMLKESYTGKEIGRLPWDE